MQIPFFLVDTFTSRPFGGAATAVLFPDASLAPELHAPIVAEVGAHNAAYVARQGDAFAVRYFDRRAELSLCTHAAMAAAHTIATAVDPGRTSVRLVGGAGPIVVTLHGGLLETDLPRLEPSPCPMPPPLAQALRVPPSEVLRAGKFVAVYQDESDLRAIGDDLAALAALDAPGVVATAPGRTHDFVYRSFAIADGRVEEEQVSASAQSRLVPYWAKRLGRPSLTAWQLSPRGAEMRCEEVDGRVRVAGRALRVAEGTFHAHPRVASADDLLAPDSDRVTRRLPG
jgi:PhzF family phenazine biosynthesis protein